MKESLFTRTYRYRQRENKNELENLCTEIFAYSFENDLIFRADFLQLLGMELGEEANVSTQQYYENIGRPDIEIIDNKKKRQKCASHPKELYKCIKIVFGD